MRYRVHHLTRYRYAEAVTTSQHDLHLLPRDMTTQRCLSSSLEVSPTPSVCQERRDYFGNRTIHVALASAHAELVVTARSLVEVERPAAAGPAPELPWEEVAASIAAGRVALAVQELSFASPHATPWEALTGYARASFPPGRPVLDACVDLMGRIHADFTYDPTATTVVTPLEEVFAIRRGVCQDFAHLMLACLRGLGLASRYVSGYLVTTPPPGQARLRGADASHAWLSVHCPRLGFVALDPTNNCVVSDQHITLAIGRDFGDVSPLRGVVFGGGRHDLKVEVDVIPTEASA